MMYFKDNKTNDIYAYDDIQISQALRITEIEHLIAAKEPIFTDLKNSVNQKTDELNRLNEQLNFIDEKSVSESEAVKNQISLAKRDLDDDLQHFALIESEYMALKAEYDAIFPVFFDIRENMEKLKKMTTTEINAYINQPASKEQLIAEAEMQKQLLADKAEKNITILERKVRLGMETDDDKSSLTAWEIYSIKVSDIDTSLAPDIDWPEKPSK